MLRNIKIVSLLWTLLHMPSGISVVIDIPENINELCPYTDICNVPAKRHLNTTGKKPCCHQCSCDRLCELHLDCCFKENDTFRLVEKGHVDCIEPIEGNSELSDIHYSYYMIKSCNVAAESVGKPCTTHDVYGNSLIAPVSSTETGYIYVNSECAQCNGQENFIEWKALFFYNYRKYYTFIRLDYAESLSNGISVLVYKPPVTVAWHNLQCFKETDFSDMKCNANEYSDTCKNVYAPYTTLYGAVYRNVYCKKCDTKNSVIDLECEDKLNGKSLNTNFGMLMDMKEVNTLRQNNKIEYLPSTTGRECNNDNITLLQKDCLKLYCPDGQIETPNGCAYLGHWWYSKFFSMQVKLLPTGRNKLLFSADLHLSTTERNTPFSWIQPPCRDANINRITVYYKCSVNDTEKETVESLIAVVGRNTISSNGFDPSIVLPLMQLCAIKPWTLRINNTTYMFKAKYDDYMRYVQDGIQRLTKFSIDSGNFIDEKQSKPAIYEVLLSTEKTTLSYSDYQMLDRSGLWLRKSYFCKQVRIPIDDIETDYGTITIVSKNITLGDNKYTLNYYRDSKGHMDYKRVTFSVCLDNYMSPESKNRGCITRMVSGCTFIMFLHVLLIAVLHAPH